MVYIIAEISNQWGGNIRVAEQMILQAKIAGADAVKIQLFGNDWKLDRYNSGLGKDYLSFTYEETVRLCSYAKMMGIDFFASPFDEERLEWCYRLDLPYIKIGNGVYKRRPELVKKIVLDGGRIIISLDREEIDKGCPYADVLYLYTERKYPTRLEEIRMPDFDQSFVAGYSDHAVGLSACFYAIARGAKIIEKHFTLSKSWQKTGEEGHYGAMDMEELRMLQATARDVSMLRQGKFLCYMA